MDRSDEPVGLRAVLGKESLGSRQGECGLHGSFAETGFRLGRATREFWSGCPKCKAAAQLEQQAEQAKEEQARLESRRARAIGLACIPARFQSHSFASFVADTPGKVRAVTAMRDFVEQFDSNLKRGSGLILAGMPGTGKTHLAGSAMLELLKRRRWTQYVTCLDMIRLVRETWRRGSERTEREVLRTLGQSIELLVVDEIGVQYGSDAEKTVVFEILDRRYSEMRPTILITNQDKEGFKTYVGERVADRLRQTHDWIAFDWPSHRATARRAQDQQDSHELKGLE